MFLILENVCEELFLNDYTSIYYWIIYLYQIINSVNWKNIDIVNKKSQKEYIDE